MSKATPHKAAGGCNRLPRGGAIFRLLSLAGGLFLLAACAMHAPSPGLTLPETKIIELRSSIVMKALLQVLRERRFVVDPQKTTAQNLQTGWLEDGSFRSMVVAGLKPIDKFRSELTVQLRVEKKSFWRKSWEPFEEIDRTACADFLNTVQIESYRTLYDGR